MIWRGALALCLFSSPVFAGGLTLSSPIDCSLSDDCYIQQFVDNDPGDGVRDYTCSDLSYDGHKGTDFALPSLARMTEGVDVLATADGLVTRFRDSMPDTGYTAETAERVDGRECGNGVVLTHADGWETQYCHLKQGSITVQKGTQVKAGDVLGQVGMSGKAQFPHIHLSVRKDGQVIDPFNPNQPNACITSPVETLWTTPPLYRGAGIISLGFADHVPSFADIKSGAPTTVHAGSPALVISAYLFGARMGDTLQLTLNGPTQEVVSKEIIYDTNKALSFRAIGRKKRGKAWPSGTYTGTATLIRNGKTLSEKSISQAFP